MTLRLPGATVAGATAELLDRATWTQLEADHQREVDELTSAHRSRVSNSRTHPVEDFLFTYYSFRPSQLRRWHPGAGFALLDGAERAEWRFHRVLTVPGSDTPAVVADVDEFVASRGKSVGFIRELLSSTAEATPQFGCFGFPGGGKGF